MSGKLVDKYGAIQAEDVEVLERCLNEISSRIERESVAGGHPPHFARICEIGMHDGNTARGIENFFKERGQQMTYWGIEPDTVSTRPRFVPANGLLIQADSAECYSAIPDGLDLVWVDGCHCMGHVILDTIHYERKVRGGGFICFHDINPIGQGLLSEHQYHGPNTPDFALAVTKGLDAIRFPWAPWRFFDQKIPPPSDGIDCGTLAFRKD